MMETEAQKKATKKWNDANKAHRNYLSFPWSGTKLYTQ